jgi:hypothetical protein
MISEPP